MQRVCVYCGSRTGSSPDFVETARNFAGELARRGLDLVYGGGNVGLMGVLADEMLAAGRRVIGVIPHGLVEREVAHQGITESHVVRTMHERKARMIELSDALVALPGGLGTLDELFEALTWAQLGIHDRPCGLLHSDAYFDALVRFLDEATTHGFVAAEARNLLHIASNPADLLDAMAAHEPSQRPRWSTQGMAGLSPLLQTRDLGRTIRFYTEKLGFAVESVWPEQDPTFCSLDCGEAHVMFFAAEEKETDIEPGMTGQLYLYTDDVMDLHRRLVGEVEILWGPEVYHYGMREFAIREINGYTLAFGQPIDAPPAQT